MDVNDIGKTGNITKGYSAYEDEQQRILDESRGRYGHKGQGEPKDYSKYFKIIIALLLIPYIAKLIQFIILMDTYSNIADIFNKMF